MTMWNKITTFCREKSLFPDKARILLAVSGGPDSMAMLDYFAKNAKNRNLQLIIAHVNHNLRGKASDGDAAFVQKKGKEYGLETHILSANVMEIAEKEGNGIESAARKARYKLLIKTALECKCGFVATAHHSDDNAETMLLNMIRGTDPKGLAGIPSSRNLWRSGRKAIRLIRPLLAVSRKEIEEYLRLNGIRSRKDSTNDDDKYTRNWIRTRLLPMIEGKQPRIREHLAEMAEKMSELF